MKNYRRFYRIGLFAIAAFCLFVAAGEVLVGIPFRRYYHPDLVSPYEIEHVVFQLLLGLMGMLEAVSLWFYRRTIAKS